MMGAGDNPGGQRRADDAGDDTEWEAEWREDIQAFLSVEMIEAALVPGRFELPKLGGASYRAFCDPSGGRQDSMTLALAHHDKTNGKIILDVLRERRPPFQPEAVVMEFCDLLKSYGVSLFRPGGPLRRNGCRRHSLSRGHSRELGPLGVGNLFEFPSASGERVGRAPGQQAVGGATLRP